jgi:hypothetical protein
MIYFHFKDLLRLPGNNSIVFTKNLQTILIIVQIEAGINLNHVDDGPRQNISYNTITLNIWLHFSKKLYIIRTIRRCTY